MKGLNPPGALRPWATLAIACASAVVVAVVLATPAFAVRSQEPLSDDSVQATVDPATGRLRDMVLEDARSFSPEIQRMFDRSVEDLEPVLLPGGILMMELPETFMEAMVVTSMPNGSLATLCAPLQSMPALAADPGTPAILLPVWASLPAANPIQAAGASGLEDR